MIHDRPLRLPLPPDAARDALAAALATMGFSAAREGEMRFSRGRAWNALFGFRIEACPTELTIGLAEAPDGGTATRFHYEIRAPFRLGDAVHRMYLDLESETAVRRAAGATAVSPAEAIKPLRDTIRTAIAVNIVVCSVLVGGVGVLAGFPLLWVALAGVAVALVNVLTIASFADLLLHGALRILRAR